MYRALDSRIQGVQGTANATLSSVDKVLKEAEVSKERAKDLETSINKVTEATNKLTSDTPYKNALLTGVGNTNRANVDPRVLSDLDRKARQILVEIYDTEGNDTMAKSLTELIGKANEAIASIDDTAKPKDVKVVTALKTRKQTVLLTLNSKEAAEWFNDPAIETTFTRAFSEGSHIRERAYNIVVPRVPITFEPKENKHLREVEEVNGLEKNTLSRVKWIKPMERRRPEQTHAYAIFSFSSVDAANNAIRDGIIVCGMKIRPKKQKQEPIQCMKCRLWGHFATECTAEVDTCGACGEAHRTKHCRNRDKWHCASCGPNTHASWDRSCPEFIRRCAILDERNPQNAMPFFPAEHDWTLTVRPERIPLDMRFPGKYAVNSLPLGGKSTGQSTRPHAATRNMSGNGPKRANASNSKRVNPNLIPISQGRKEGVILSEDDIWNMDPVWGEPYESLEDEFSPDRIKGWD
jgi:hypothetical protein